VVPMSGRLALNLNAPDVDGDGVYFAADLCPSVNASFFDRNGDGCVDEYIGARHTEYWQEGLIIHYYVQMDGAPNIGDGSDFAAIENSVGKWTRLVGVDIEAFTAARWTGTWRSRATETTSSHSSITNTTSGRTPWRSVWRRLSTCHVCERTSLPPWRDRGRRHDFQPGENVHHIGRLRGRSRERGHARSGSPFGISHSAAKNSIMFYALQDGTEGRTLSYEDVTIVEKAYPDPRGCPRRGASSGA